MNIHLIIKGRALYARAAKRRTGAALAKMKMLAAYSKSLRLQREDAPAGTRQQAAPTAETPKKTVPPERATAPQMPRR